MMVLTVFTMIVTSFLLVANWSFYRSPMDLAEFRESMLSELERQYEITGSVPEEEKEETLNKIHDDIDRHLTLSRFASHSLYRVIGNLLVLIGALLFRRMPQNGFRIMLVGSILTIATGFIFFGTSFIGWSFNLFYILSASIVMPIFFIFQRKLNKAAQQYDESTVE